MSVVVYIIKQETAYEISECEWSLDVCSSDLGGNKIFCAALGKGIGVFDVAKPINASNMRFISVSGSIMKTAKMILDKNNKLWVMCTASGKTLLHCINPDNEIVEKTIEIPYVKKGDDNFEIGCITNGNSFNRIDTDASKGKLYFLMQVLKVKERNLSINAIITLDVDKNDVEKAPYREIGRASCRERV